MGLNWLQQLALQVGHFLQSNLCGPLSPREREAAARHGNGDTGTLAPEDRIALQRLGRAGGALDGKTSRLMTNIMNASHQASGGVMETRTDDGSNAETPELYDAYNGSFHNEVAGIIVDQVLTSIGKAQVSTTQRGNQPSPSLSMNRQ